MARSAMGAAVSVSVEVLLIVLESVVPAGVVTVAVLTRLPVAEERALPLTVKTTELPAPDGMLTVAARLLPEPVEPAVTAALPLVLEVQVTLVRAAGKVSATEAP